MENLGNPDIVRAGIIESVENQIRDNNPPETRATFNRLKREGFNETDAKEMIAYCLSIEIFNVIRHGEKYNEEEYVKNLLALPNLPDE